MNATLFVLLVSVSCCSSLLFAEAMELDAKDSCLLEALKLSDEQTPAIELKSRCDYVVEDTVLRRTRVEKLTEQNNFVITPHRQNYMLFSTYNDNPNQAPWLTQQSFPGLNKPIQNEEAKFQTSFKVPLNKRDILFEDDSIYFGLTFKFFWQMYNKKISVPFRETNYRPEIFYQSPLPYKFMGGRFLARLGFEHESNGRSQYLSRSWNRVFAGLGYRRDNWIMYLQPWYRLPETRKVMDDDPDTPPPAKGDDNPDIEDFYGHYEFFAIYKNNEFELSNMLRFNFETGKGAFETGLSFPLFNRLRGYIQFYNGYGESLIDYNHRVQRIGVGVLLTDFL